MSFTSLLKRLFATQEERAVDEFISFDRSGRARFDLAGYLSSDEGAQRVEEIAEKTRAPLVKVNKAA